MHGGQRPISPQVLTKDRRPPLLCRHCIVSVFLGLTNTCCNRNGAVSKISIVKRGVERAGATALIYHENSKESCSEGEVEEWLRRRRSGEEERVLFLDREVIRGWEASHLLVVAFRAFGYENLIMRAVGYCAIVKKK